MCRCLTDEAKEDKKLKYQYIEFEEGDIKRTNEKNVEGDEVSIKKVDKKDYKPKNKFAWIMGSIIGVICIGVVVFLLLLPKITKVPDVKIPDVSNMTIVEAETELRKAGFVVDVKVEEVYSDTVEEGKVVKTNPTINRTVKKGTTITLYQSKGTEKIKIEDYKDQNIYEVKAKLEIKGLKVLVESKDVDDVKEYEDKEDIIIDQNPISGELNKGDQIILYYPNIVVYPDLTIYSLSEVQDFATKYDLVLYVEEVETESAEPGTILSQSRRQNTLIARGADLTIKVAVLPKEENEPSHEVENKEKENKEEQ